MEKAGVSGLVIHSTSKCKCISFSQHLCTGSRTWSFFLASCLLAPYLFRLCLSPFQASLSLREQARLRLGHSSLEQSSRSKAVGRAMIFPIPGMVSAGLHQNGVCRLQVHQEQHQDQSPQVSCKVSSHAQLYPPLGQGNTHISLFTPCPTNPLPGTDVWLIWIFYNGPDSAQEEARTDREYSVSRSHSSCWLLHLQSCLLTQSHSVG